jgi:hypothetical protein
MEWVESPNGPTRVGTLEDVKRLLAHMGR